LTPGSATLRPAIGGILVMGVLLAVAGCRKPPPSGAEQQRIARAMVKVEVDQAESDRTLPARNAANARQVIVINQQAK
jgi:hypothetical protein